MECVCDKIYTIYNNPKVLIHIQGCPESAYAKKYRAKKWWQRLFMGDPNLMYIEILLIKFS